MENVSNAYYNITFMGSLVTIKVKKGIFNLLTERNESDLLYDYLNNIQYNTKVKALLFTNDKEAYNDVAYDDFLSRIINTADLQFNSSLHLKDKDLRRNEITNLDRFVKELSKFKKICFTVLSGGIVTPFFGAALSMDFQYAAPDMKFLLAHNKYRLHPSGGLPYFLTRQVGYLKAMEILFLEEINAEEALRLGLINEIISEENLMEIVLRKVSNIIENSSNTLRRTKQLAAFTRDKLDDYFLYEKSLLNL